MELSTMGGNLKIENDLMDFYCEINVNSTCRVCLEKNQTNKRMYNIFEAKIQLDISNMIMSCASVQLLQGDGLPNMICHKCMSNLNVAWQFKTQCEKSDAKLKLYSSQMPLSDSMDNFGLKESYGLKSDAECKLQFFDNITQGTQENELPEKHSDGESKKKRPRHKSDKSKEYKVHQCDTCGKTFNRREYLTQHIRIHTGEKPYHCHLCEKRFVNSGHLTTHMRTHTGERPHSCSQCPKAFSTRQELQKHTMVHNGERPFVCKMCGKRFGSSSNLYSHLKHHTGEKNFTCEHCGKPFYTKQELKQHLVVHTGEKAFVCDYCNKRFSQIAHLRRHSKLHRGNV